MCYRPSASVRTAFTLLEVILALALAGLLLSVVSMAISTYWRATDHGRTAVENAQLARALLAKIASDLKASVIVAPDPAEMLAEATSSANSMGGLGLDGLGMNDPLAGLGDGLGLSDDAWGALEVDSEGAITGAMTPLGIQPGIYGNQFELQMDISRPLRPDERMLADSMLGGAVAAPMGVTTLSYFVIDEMTPAMMLPHPDLVGQKGLVRREANRAVAAWATSNSMSPASMQMIPQQLDVLAPEVVGLEFSYFDGLTWYPAWDSELMQATPVAVEIVLTLRTQRAAPRPAMTNLLSNSAGDEQFDQYRLVVHLPGGVSAMTIMAQQEAAALEAAGMSETMAP